MPNEFKAFIVSVGVILLLMWITIGVFEVGDSPISIVFLLIAFGLTYAWVKNEFFPSKSEGDNENQ